MHTFKKRPEGHYEVGIVLVEKWNVVAETDDVIAAVKLVNYLNGGEPISSSSYVFGGLL